MSPTVNIGRTLSDAARDRPHALAVACPAGRDRAGRTAYTHWSFQQLDTESDLLASGLAHYGIGRGVRAALMVKPGMEFFALTFALFKAGAVPVLIDPGIGLRNMGRCLDEAKPRAFLGIPAAQAARRVLGWGRSSLQVSVTVKPVDPKRLPRGTADRRSPSLSQVYRAGLEAGEPDQEVATDPHDLAAILFTSGSTGPPKGVVYTHAIFLAQIAALKSLYAIEPGEVDLCTFPLFALFAPALGMTSVVPVMDATRPALVAPDNIFEPIQTFGVTNLFGSPALLKRVGDHGSKLGYKLPSLRRVISAGAPVPARVVERFASMLDPGVQIFTPYGATESLPISSIGSAEILGETRLATDRGAGVCVGRPAAGMRVDLIKITDEAVRYWSDELAIPEGTVGEIVVKGPVVTPQYFNRRDETLRAKIDLPRSPFKLQTDGSLDSYLIEMFDASGGPVRTIGFGFDGLSAYLAEAAGLVRHRTGDLGYRDGQGRLWFCGRKAHRVVTDTQTLYTIPCEAVFNTHEAVNRSALVGVGRRGTQVPVLCVEPKTWPLSRPVRDAVIVDLRRIAGSFPHTSMIDTFLFRKAFPVDIRHNAKIFREKLAVWAASRLPR